MIRAMSLLAVVTCLMLVASPADAKHRSSRGRNTPTGGKNDWRVQNCRANSITDSIANACIECTKTLNQDNRDFACYDWCAKYAQTDEDMQICVACVTLGYESGRYDPWACSQCNQYADGNGGFHRSCSHCLSRGVPDYYCIKTVKDGDDVFAKYRCLAGVNKKSNQDLEACMNAEEDDDGDWRRRSA